MIPRDKPKDVWDSEWVAMHANFRFPEVTDAGFLAAFKKVMIEVAGDRLYDYRAAEQVDALLIAGGHSCPIMEQEAAAEGFSRYKKIRDFIRSEMESLQAATNEWRERIGEEEFNDDSVLDGVDPALIERLKKLSQPQAVPGKPGKYTLSQRLEMEVEEQMQRDLQAAREAYERREAEEKASEIASYPKREDWP